MGVKRENLPKIAVFGDPKKGHTAEAIRQFSRFVEGKARIVASGHVGQCDSLMPDNCDLVIVFGGDGSIISTARALGQKVIPVVGVNLGKLGFLAEFSLEELKEVFGTILAGKVMVEKRMMLSCSVIAGGAASSGPGVAALNDVFITAGPPFGMIELRVSVDGQDLAGCVSDGLVISTPTGSTAYNLSAGGPILSTNIEAMVVTPICPHSLSFRPIVISDESTVEVIGVRLNEGTTVSVDGQVSMGLSTRDVVVVKKHASAFHVVNNPLRTQWDTLATKLSWAEKLRYKSDRNVK